MRFLARLFSYTRGLEDQHVTDAFRIGELKTQLEVERLRNVGDLEVLRERYEDARNDLAESNRERRYLQDRLCQKLGIPPIFEPSPGQVAQQQESASRGSLVRKGPRDTAIAAGIDARTKQKKIIQTEVSDFLKEQGANA